MKFHFIIFETKVPGWVSEGRDEFVKKIAGFLPIEVQTLKSPSFDRDQGDKKRLKEGELLLSKVADRDLLVLFDEHGKLAKTSEDFSAVLRCVLESGKQRVVFVIGGAYGFSEPVLKRADFKWSMSPLTMNHLVAQLMALEQIYRGLTLLKGIPYHNR